MSREKQYIVSLHNNRSSKNDCIGYEAEWSGLVCESMSIADDSVLLTESKNNLQRVIDQFHGECE